MKRSGIYQIVNEVNGKSYVGSSIDILNRWRQWRHYAVDNARLQYRPLLVYAFQKYGVENFTFLILEECEPSKEVLEVREQHYLDSLQPEYNLSPTAYSMAGYKFSEEQKQFLRDNYSEERKLAASERSTAYMSDPENKQRYSELRKGKTFEDIFGEERAKEVLAKQSENRTGKHVGFDPWNKGIPQSDEQKEKLSVARNEWIAAGGEPWNKGVLMSKELYDKLEAGGFWEVTDQKRQHMSDAKIGLDPWNKDKTMSEAYCQSMADAAKARHDATPELQAALTEAARLANTGKSRPQEVSDRIRASNLASEARKAFAESRRGIPRTADVKQKVSETLQTSEKAKAFHESRRGKPSKPSKSGHYGISWRNDSKKWVVRIENKKYGNFDNLEDAIKRRDEVIALNQSHGD